jgi:4-hydroxybutyrate dehydrogenase
MSEYQYVISVPSKKRTRRYSESKNNKENRQAREAKSMGFFIKTGIGGNDTFQRFLRQRRIGRGDLIVGGERVLKPLFSEKPLPCDVLYREIRDDDEPDDGAADAILEAIDGLEAQNGEAYKRIVAVGGRPIIDMAKLSVFGGGLRCAEIFEKGAPLPRKRKLLVVPAICGTVGEVTDTVTIAFRKQGAKRELSSPALFPDEAILIGELLSALPYEVFAASSIEALGYAMESYVSPEATAFTQTVGESAMERILTGYKKLAEKNGAKDAIPPNDLQSFLTASAMAGMAAGGAGSGIAHALSRPVSALCGVSLGKAHHLIFEEVFTAYRRLNADTSSLEEALSAILSCGREDVWENLFELLARVLPRQPLREFGVDEARCREMASLAVRERRQPLSAGPLKISGEVIEDIYKKCM